MLILIFGIVAPAIAICVAQFIAGDLDIYSTGGNND